MKKYYLFIGFIGVFFAFKNISKLPEDVNAAYLKLPLVIDYNEHVKPILSDKCFKCHGPDKAKQKAGLRLDMEASAYGPLPESPEKFAIVPGNLNKSELYHRILSSDPGYMMPDPKSHLTLDAKEKAILIKWIETGAVYKPHWAFVAPQKKAIPDIYNLQVNNPIDNFVFSRLQQEGLQPSPKASKEILLRRLSLDLTGLPPTVDEIDQFLNDQSANAYEKQVDRLLSSQHYGEKMATQWLDLARFADSYGYTVDRTRDMSVYRDWVIGAFNENMSYKNFIHYQLAGDLMPSPTKDMIIATAFNRNHPQNMEGGIIEEEFQTEYVMDRTNTFGEAFLSISVGCARCHDHKYDPVSQENYYELYSFFNNVREAGQISWNDDMPTPTLMLPTAEEEKTIQYINSLVKEKEAQLKLSYENASNEFNEWIQQEKYKTISSKGVPVENLQGFYSFEDSLKNSVNNSKTAILRRDWDTKSEPLKFEKNENGQSLYLNGDTYLDLKEVGVFRKSEPFTIGLWINIPKEMKEGVIFHKSNAERLYNFKGYHVYLKNNRLEMTMAHTAPSNAITKLSLTDVPRNQWIQLTMTYDGSSTAKGLNLFIDGAPLKMETQIDQLYKDIVFFSKDEPGLQIGAWYRGFGVKGGKLDDVSVYNRALTPFEIKVLAKKTNWDLITKKTSTELTKEDISVLKEYYNSVVNVAIKNA
ncbi:MAG: DUF1549 domain-containing protein, partial [Chitinophagia bacterium]|nr:DUF1549 domain-containing protein [Chitinophagia bacterium]